MARDKTPKLFCDDGAEIVLPFTWTICGGCEGHGKSSSHLGAFTQSEMSEQGPEFFDDYMNGVYDATCDECGGSGKIKVADFSRMTKAQRIEYRAQRRADAGIDAIHAAERAIGA